ncbi:glycoside hydrolase family 131 protein [Peniophora sp. CONT]|nr:glycoside hydrolase family 131 protein [Peniophora sp. CONT]
MFQPQNFLCILNLLVGVQATVLFDGRLGASYAASDLDTSTGPYLSVVKGSENATHYTSISHALGTPLWGLEDRPILITIDNSSVFVPGGTPQLGFRRTDLIAQPSAPGANRTTFNNEVLESGVTTFHFSVQADRSHPLNLAHEYQVVWIEPNDGSHVFDLQIGTPFNTTATSQSHHLKVRSKNGTVLFSTPFTATTWHNFAVTVDWDALTLETSYSAEGAKLKRVATATSNVGAVRGPTGQGDFHIAVLKLPLIDPTDTPAEQADVVHFGIQEGTKEGLFFSGVFVERA